MNTTYTTLAGIAGICLLIGFTAALSFRQEIRLALRKKKTKNPNRSLEIKSLEIFPEEHSFGGTRHRLTIPGKKEVSEASDFANTI